MGKRRTPIDWKSYNNELVNRGTRFARIVEDFKANEPLLRDELESMNEGKIGGQFLYPDTVIVFLATIKICTMKGYRWVEGFAHLFLDNVPSYTQICRRFASLPGELLAKLEQESVCSAVRGPTIDVILDATGVQINGKSVWIDEKFKTRRKRKWKKLHIVIDRQSRAILSLRVIGKDKHEGESEEFRASLRSAKSRLPESVKIEKVFGDSGYDSVDNFDNCKKENIKPIIRVRKSTIAKLKREKDINEQLLLCGRRLEREYTYRDKCAIEQINWDEFVEKSGYGKRSVEEGVIGSFKRTFGENVYSRVEGAILRECRLKGVIWNWMIGMIG
ncbi:MAG: IS5 family transposase [bacterium]